MMIIAPFCIDMKLKLYETLVFMVIHDFAMCFFGPSWILVLILVLRGGKLWTR